PTGRGAAEPHRTAPRPPKAARHPLLAVNSELTQSIGSSSNLTRIIPASELAVADCTVELILSFLDTLEECRSNCIRTRNTRLAAIKSFFRYLEIYSPSCLESARQVHAIPFKQWKRPALTYLTRDEIEVLLAAPGCKKPNDIRDHAMFWIAYPCGLRVSELINLTFDSLDHNLKAIHVTGKGRRERQLPLWTDTRAALRAWLKIRPGDPTGPLFLNHHGEQITRHGFASRLAVHVPVAARMAPSLARKRVSPHTLRHTCAMHMLAATRDIASVSLWLGHATIEATEAYLHHDLDLKLQMLQEHDAPRIRAGSFGSKVDDVLSMLNDIRKGPK
ncbi:MAG: tyrosine-type recombinase/integrase, partial [Immundisolibacterales bacterium]|nr:tyrosine-type recombinase/integrase [Immundisolibacterales bacterium]